MSYILEALRKAEAERRRGAVPDLHAQVLPSGAAGAGTAPARSALPLWLAGAALLALGAAVAWLLLGRAAPPAPVAAPAPMTAPPAPPVTAPPRAELPPPSPAPSAPAVVAAAPEKAPAPARKSPPAVKREAPTATAKMAPRSAPQAPKIDSAPPPVAEPAVSARVPALTELPGDLRQQVPALTIGGSVYSPQASARMVVVNGQVFQEGNTLAPELKLEQIRPKTAVFSIRGTRFEVPL